MIQGSGVSGVCEDSSSGSNSATVADNTVAGAIIVAGALLTAAAGVVF